MAKPRLYVEAKDVFVKWVCTGCNKKNHTNKIDLDVDGGCQGHGPDEYCYCSDRQIIAVGECEECLVDTQIDLAYA